MNRNNSGALLFIFNVLLSFFSITAEAQEKNNAKIFMYFENENSLTKFTCNTGRIIYSPNSGELRIFMNTDDFVSSDKTQDSTMKLWDETLVFTTMLTTNDFKIHYEENSSSYIPFEGMISTKNSKTKAKGYYDILNLTNSQNQTLYNTRMFVLLTFEVNGLNAPVKSALPVRLELIEGEINVKN